MSCRREASNPGRMVSIGAIAIALLIGLAVGPLEVGLDAQPAPVDEFVPLDEIPPEDQLPAAPLLITAYAVVWLLVLGYLWSIWRRMGTVERELGELARRVERPD